VYHIDSVCTCAHYLGHVLQENAKAPKGRLDQVLF